MDAERWPTLSRRPAVIWVASSVRRQDGTAMNVGAIFSLELLWARLVTNETIPAGVMLSSKIAATADRLRSLPGMCSLDRLAYLVTPLEWMMLTDCTEFYSPIREHEIGCPITELKIAGLAVKIDHRASETQPGDGK